MKFSAVIGNPPYNKGMDIDFAILGFGLTSKYVVLIIPAKWQTSERDGQAVSRYNYGQFRDTLVQHMSTVCFYPESSNVFRVAQSDGITYFLVDKENTFDKCKVINKCDEQALFNNECTREIIKQQSLNNLGQEIIEYMMPYKPFKWPTFNGGHYEVWTARKLSTSGNGRTMIRKDGNTLVTQKVFIYDNFDGQGNDTADSCQIYASDDKSKCESLSSYLNTKFVRFFVLMNISKLTGVCTDYYYRFVPEPPNSDYEFTHIWTDEDLYEYYGLNREDAKTASGLRYRDIIETIVRDREN